MAEDGRSSAVVPWAALEAVGWRLSDFRGDVDRDLLWRWPSEDAYWSRGRSRHEVDLLVDHSVTLVALDEEDRQRGFARCVTDHITIGWIDDVYVDRPARGRGVGQWMMTTMLSLPVLAAVPKFLLMTADAHGHYAKVGFQPLSEPHLLMAWTRKPPDRSVAPLES